MATSLKYLCLVYCEESKLRSFPDGERMDFGAIIREGGRCLAFGALRHARSGATVRIVEGRVSVADGLLAEPKDQLTSFCLVEARDLNEAIQVAVAMPPARTGSIEVRPIREPAGRSLEARAVNGAA